jgi:hypothetical protein
MTFNRRSLLAAGVSLTALSAFGKTASPTAADFSKLADKRRAMARLRTGPSGAGIWWYRGTFFGKPDGEITRPLMTVSGASITRIEGTSADQDSYILSEAGYFSDLNSGEILDDWRNPFNDRVVKPRHYRSTAQYVTDGVAVTPASATLPPGMVFRGNLSPINVEGDAVWFSEDLFASAPMPGEPHPSILTSLATFHGRLTELNDPTLDFVPCRLAYQTLGSFSDWMQMGDSPGVISWRISGEKIASRNALPAATAEWLAREHAELFANMGAL